MISVCMACYNGEAFIEKQLNSILNQLRESDELIISDNASTDNTVSIIKSINDKRIKLLNNPRQTKYARINCIQNFENALKHARGEIIFLSDQDDIWEPERISHVLPYLENYDIIVNDCKLIDEDGIVQADSYFQIRKSGKGIVKNFFTNTYLGCCMCFKRKVLSLCLPFPKSISMHDIWIGLVGELFFKTFFLEKALVLYRNHGRNVSPTAANNSKYNMFEKLMFRINTIKWIPLILKRYFFYK